MKSLLPLFLFITGYFSSAGQGYGAQWVIGDNISVLDFRDDTLKNYPIGPTMPMFLTEANICDSNGNLLYYTNGIYIAGADGNQIANGDSLSPCEHTNENVCCGLDIPQGVLFVPMPGNSRYYYLFHMSDDTLSDSRPGTLYYSIIDQQGDSDRGEVISKNIIYYKGIFRDGGMTACKHGNGRDWWVVMGDRYNTYYKFLLTPNGISDTLMQTIGPSFHNPSDIAYSKFTQDGTKYVTGCNVGGILVMDFDRCTGEFSNPVNIFNNVSTPSTPISGGWPEFSASGRFIYVSNSIAINQFDLWATNPQLDSSMVSAADSSDPYQIGYPQIAPDGKLYISCFDGGSGFLHVINNPDNKGDSCVYIDTGLVTLTENTIPLPNMINYNLGPLAGSACDTILGIKQQSLDNISLRIMPNPADKYVYVEMGMQGNYEFDLLNAVGQVIDKKLTRKVDIFNTGELAGGVYIIKITDKGNLNSVLTQKLVVQH
jgi:Secretion system C-terminal sorting domain